MWKRFCNMFSEKSTGSWAELQLTCCPSEQGEPSSTCRPRLYLNVNLSGLQGGASGRIVGWVDSDLGCSTLCLVLLGLLGNWQKWLSSWEVWWNILNHSQPNPTVRPDAPPCIYGLTNRSVYRPGRLTVDHYPQAEGVSVPRQAAQSGSSACGELVRGEVQGLD